MQNRRGGCEAMEAIGTALGIAFRDALGEFHYSQQPRLTPKPARKKTVKPRQRGQGISMVLRE